MRTTTTNLPKDALAFECATHSVYAPGTVVQLVDYGLADKDDRDEDDGRRYFVHAQAVHEDDAEWPESWSTEKWYFRHDDLRPLTPAARAVLEDLMWRRGR